ncbi:dynactin Arp1 p62 subunit RO2 [Aspergillus arachidicola]|uniref:Dynactin subunit 4 n=1 Tax=Aspergillus arachidicola TaxID=656916 RepID=A0A2G7FT08_9EURO|nr:dynactin Arp1 p62 subunit RO2 [Aspergillus arachidicola]
MASDDCGWDGMASIEQRTFQSPDARFVEDLLPLPVLLRTKRSKRCKSCKHILVKPEFKPQSTRFRIRLIALSYIPLPTLKPLVPSPFAGLPSVTSAAAPNLDALSPLKTVQLQLTLKNHMFEPVRVTLATPSVTPGRVASKVTILCPQFDIGANSDVWDEALQGSTAPGDARSSRSGTLGSTEKVAEAGKVWDKGRNWTTVVLEVVPGTLPGGGATGRNRMKQHHDDNDDDNDDSDADSDADSDVNANALDWSGQTKDPNQQLQPDEDVLEIPVFVRMEWDSENQIDQEQSVGKGQNSDTVKRELAYWMVLGVGRISPEMGF